jgi:hypothetical protein
LIVRKLLLIVGLGLGACADRLTGPAARSAAEAYQYKPFDSRTRLFVNGVERDTSVLRSLDKKLIDSIFIVVTENDVADGVSSSRSVIQVFVRPPK